MNLENALTMAAKLNIRVVFPSEEEIEWGEAPISTVDKTGKTKSFDGYRELIAYIEDEMEEKGIRKR